MSDGMAMSISYWGNKAKTMDWLDDEVCPDIDCKKHNAGIGVISAIRVEGPEPPGMTSLSPSSPTVQPWFPSSTLPMWVPVYTLPWNPSPNSGPAATAPPLPGLPGGAASSTSQTTRSSLASKFLNPRVALAAAVAAIAVAGVALTVCPSFFFRPRHAGLPGMHRHAGFGGAPAHLVGGQHFVGGPPGGFAQGHPMGSVGQNPRFTFAPHP